MAWEKHEHIHLSSSHLLLFQKQQWILRRMMDHLRPSPRILGPRNPLWTKQNHKVFYIVDIFISEQQSTMISVHYFWHTWPFSLVLVLRMLSLSLYLLSLLFSICIFLPNLPVDNCGDNQSPLLQSSDALLEEFGVRTSTQGEFFVFSLVLIVSIFKCKPNNLVGLLYNTWKTLKISRFMQKIYGFSSGYSETYSLKEYRWSNPLHHLLHCNQRELQTSIK